MKLDGVDCEVLYQLEARGTVVQLVKSSLQGPSKHFHLHAHAKMIRMPPQLDAVVVPVGDTRIEVGYLHDFGRPPWTASKRCHLQGLMQRAWVTA